LLQSLTALNYPRHLFEIQVLDDSTDETAGIIDEQVAIIKQRGFAISVLRREIREGYKAGALQQGLPECKGELIAIFDADFRPQTDFLRSLIPHFKDSTGRTGTGKVGTPEPGSKTSSPVFKPTSLICILQ
jgi:cellulose synthase/poly-beta-1,6-N-acetylglucosamine synthase-like glycosyltransferase